MDPDPANPFESWNLASGDALAADCEMPLGCRVSGCFGVGMENGSACKEGAEETVATNQYESVISEQALWRGPSGECLEERKGSQRRAQAFLPGVPPKSGHI
jgi:hypothetical protein